MSSDGQVDAHLECYSLLYVHVRNKSVVRDFCDHTRTSKVGFAIFSEYFFRTTAQAVRIFMHAFMNVNALESFVRTQQLCTKTVVRTFVNSSRDQQLIHVMHMPADRKIAQRLGLKQLSRKDHAITLLHLHYLFTYQSRLCK